MVPLLDSLHLRNEAQFDVSDNGLLIAAQGPNWSALRFNWLNEDGTFEQLPFSADTYRDFTISPTGDRLAVTVRNLDGRDIWIYDIERGSSVRLTNDGINFFPIWSPDGQSIFFQYKKAGRTALVRKNINNLSDPDTLSTKNMTPTFITGDGRYLGVLMEGSQSVDLYYLALDSPTELHSIASNPDATEVLAEISHDNKLVAYTSSQTGNYEVYVQSFPPDGNVYSVSVGGGEEPVWSVNDDFIYYRNGDHLYKVSVSPGQERVTFGDPELVYAGAFENVSGYSIDVSPTTGRVLMLKGEQEITPITSLELITNITSLVENQ